MNTYTASRRRDCLMTVAFWLRSCNDESAILCPELARKYVNNARKALDELLVDMFGDEQESEPESAGKEGVA